MLRWFFMHDTCKATDSTKQFSQARPSLGGRCPQPSLAIIKYLVTRYSTRYTRVSYTYTGYLGLVVYFIPSGNQISFGFFCSFSLI